MLLHLDIETFYLFAKILLDRIADAFAHLFVLEWKGRGSSHQQLVRILPNVALTRQLTEPPQELLDLLRETRDRIVNYRNAYIEHPDGRDFFQATSFHPTMGVSIVTGETVFPLPGLQPDLPTSQDPRLILPLLDRYIETMLRFIEANTSSWPRAIESPKD